MENQDILNIEAVSIIHFVRRSISLFTLIILASRSVRSFVKREKNVIDTIIDLVLFCLLVMKI